MTNFGSGLIHLGLAPPNSDSMKLLGFYSKNRMEWVIAEQACYAYSIIPVPLYDTLGADSVEYVVNQTELATILCSSVETLTVIDGVKPNSPSLTTIIQMEVVYHFLLLASIYYLFIYFEKDLMENANPSEKKREKFAYFIYFVFRKFLQMYEIVQDNKDCRFTLSLKSKNRSVSFSVPYSFFFFELLLLKMHRCIDIDSLCISFRGE